MNNIKKIDVTHKNVLMRVDFNVPFDNHGAISDDTRIRAVLPTIDYLLNQNAQIILISHCGRPKGERNPKFSLGPVAKRLGELIKKDVPLAPDCIGPEVEKMIDALRPGEVLLLENVRFHAEEQKNDPEFSRKLAALGDVYVNDAFAVSHRAHASVEGVTHHMKQCAAGFLLYKEIEFFKRSVTNPNRPLIAILGGAKVSSKLGAIKNMLDRVDVMIIGGAMANTFLKSQGVDVGKSLVENDLLDTAREFINLARQKGVSFLLPTDCVAAATFDAHARTKVTTVDNIPSDWMVLDIGPATAEFYAQSLQGAKTIVWNGPMGAFEMEPFAKGSLALVKAVCNTDALSIVGGGDTNVVIHKAGAADHVSYMSTGGGAFLMLMEGKELPGVSAL